MMNSRTFSQSAFLAASFSLGLSLCASAQSLTLTSSVYASGGGEADGGGFHSYFVVGQGDLVGQLADSQRIAHPGFLGTFLQFPALDTDGDGIADGNDPDDDNDGLGDRSEIRGDRFTPIRPTNPLDPDPDHDGSSDGEEEIAETDPRDFTSVLRILGIFPDGNDIDLTFSSVSGRDYEIFYTFDLTPENWLALLALAALGISPSIHAADLDLDGIDGARGEELMFRFALYYHTFPTTDFASGVKGVAPLVS